MLFLYKFSCVAIQEDEELAAAVDSEFAALETPLNIVQVEARHHALDLYEQVSSNKLYDNNVI